MALELDKQVELYRAGLKVMLKVVDGADSGELTDEEMEQLSCGYNDAMSGRIACGRIVGKKKNDRIDPGLTNITSLLLKILYKREFPEQKPPSSVMYVRLTGPERKQAIKNTLSIFNAAEVLVSMQLAPSNIIRLELALRFSQFYYQILKSPDAARSIAMQAVDKAFPEYKAIITEVKQEMAVLDKERDRFVTFLHVLCHNITYWTNMMQDDGVTETNKQENNGAESSVKRRKLGLGCGFENESMDTLREWLVNHAKSYEKMVGMMEKMATAVDSRPLTREECSVMKSACINAQNASIGYGKIISYIKEEKKNDNDWLTEFDPAACSFKVGKVLLKVLDSREITYNASGHIKVEFLRRKAEIYEHLLLDESMDRKEVVDNILSTFKAAQDTARAALAPSHPERLGLAINFSDFHYNILNSAEDACKIAKQAFDEAVAENPALELDEAAIDTDKCRVAMGVLRRNITHWTSIMQGKKEEKMQEEEKEDNGADCRMPSLN